MDIGGVKHDRVIPCAWLWIGGGWRGTRSAVLQDIWVGAGLGQRYSVNGQGPVLATPSQSLCFHTSPLEALTYRLFQSQPNVSLALEVSSDSLTCCLKMCFCKSLFCRNLTHDFHFIVFKFDTYFWNFGSSLKICIIIAMIMHWSVKVNFLWCLMIKGRQKELQSGFG